MEFKPNEIKPFTLEEFSPEEPDPAQPEEAPEAFGEEVPAPADQDTPPPLDQSEGFTVSSFLHLNGNTPAPEPIPEPDRTLLDDEKVAKSEQFRSQEFTAESSLLTNAEAYAETIREGARIYSERMHTEANALQEQAKQALEEAQQVRQQAEKEKQTLLEAAQAQVQEIKDAAHQEGFAQGEQAGTEKRYQELVPQVEQINDLMAQLSRLRQIVRFQGEQELLQLASLVAKKVVYEELSINPNVLYNIARRSLQEIEALGKIRILIHPGDYDFLLKAQAQLEQYTKEEQTLVIAANIDAKPGELLVETDETVINFHFQKQFEAIEAALSQKLEERQTQLYNVDMDAYDFDAPPNLPLANDPEPMLAAPDPPLTPKNEPTQT